jgi:hypothetical protein
MGPETTGHMLLGAIIGWGILSPLAKSKGWAPGPVQDWATGSRGWLVWVSLAVMLADSIISLSGIVIEPVTRAAFNKRGLRGRQSDYEPLPAEEEEEETPGHFPGLRRRFGARNNQDETPEKDADPSFLVPNSIVFWGLAASGVLCIVAIRVVFGQVPLYATVVAFLLALVLSVMGVRALGRPLYPFSWVLSADVPRSNRPQSRIRSFKAYPAHFRSDCPSHKPRSGCYQPCCWCRL